MIRDIVDHVGSLTCGEIDYLTERVFSNGIPGHSRSNNAWSIVAWHTIIRPYDHPKRSHFISLRPFINIIWEDAETLYTYAVVIIKVPDVQVYSKLKNLNPKVAKSYQDYCRNYAIAQEINQIDRWSATW